MLDTYILVDDNLLNLLDSYTHIFTFTTRNHHDCNAVMDPLLHLYSGGILRTTFPSFLACILSFSSTEDLPHRSGGVRLSVAQ